MNLGEKVSPGQRDGTGPADTGPVFVVGMNGSGTTMMLNCLNGHHELYGFPRETLVIPYYLSRVSNYGDLADSASFRALWDDFRNEPPFRWANGGEPPPVPEDWKEMPRRLRTVIDQTYGYFARTQGKRRWCEKTPMHAQHIAALHAIFPDAYFIHMIRDGRSSAASFHRRWGYIPQRTIYRWRSVIAAARRQAAASGARYVEVFYEKLTEDPETQMRRVCDFIGVEYEDAVLSVSRKPKHSGSSADTIVQSAPRWRSYFKPRQIAVLESIAGKTLTELGYEAQQTRVDHEPTGLTLRVWMLRDYLRRAWMIVREHFSTPANQRWGDLGGKIRRAILQRLSSRY